jgi:predicted deacetylase
VNLRFVYRIDDIHPAMMWNRFWEVMAMMEAHQVVPLLGVIPDNQDQSLMFDLPNPEFFSIIRSLVSDGKAEICQHGYQHVYTTQQHSINQTLYGRVSSSEFVGIPYEHQYQMIKNGKEILKSQGLCTDIWMAPSHTSDRNTFRALNELGFKYVTDGVALYPYELYGLLFVPQQIFRPKKDFPFNYGVFTICLHLNNLTTDRINEIKSHINSGGTIISFSEAAQLPHKWFHIGSNALYKSKRIASHLVVRPLRGLKK